MELQTGCIYLVDHEIKGMFYMEVKETNEVFTKGRIIRRKADEVKQNCVNCESDLIKIRNSLTTFRLHNLENVLVTAERI
ncbi:MAG: hypothetical protein GY928_25865 [Colwellia sp.]|nr:hypothetical protein [Colwellia sp.]